MHPGYNIYYTLILTAITYLRCIIDTRLLITTNYSFYNTTRKQSSLKIMADLSQAIGSNYY